MKKTKIDWADSTWNPVTGCLHNCSYCYARGIATRFSQSDEDCIRENADTFTMKWLPLYQTFIYHFKQQPWKVTESGKHAKSPYPCGFAPAFHEYRLGEVAAWTKPRNIFVCSMADLFGEWVPDEWIKAVFEACEKEPQHRYMFLTKNPDRYFALDEAGLLPNKENYYYGASADTAERADKWSELLYTHESQFNVFASVEPMLERFNKGTAAALFAYVPWVIVGAESGFRKGQVTPAKEWIDILAAESKLFGGAIFMKESLRAIVGDDFKQQFPWRVKP